MKLKLTLLGLLITIFSYSESIINTRGVDRVVYGGDTCDIYFSGDTLIIDSPTQTIFKMQGFSKLIFNDDTITPLYLDCIDVNCDSAYLKFNNNTDSIKIGGSVSGSSGTGNITSAVAQNLSTQVENGVLINRADTLFSSVYFNYTVAGGLSIINTDTYQTFITTDVSEPAILLNAKLDNDYGALFTMRDNYYNFRVEDNTDNEDTRFTHDSSYFYNIKALIIRNDGTVSVNDDLDMGGNLTVDGNTKLGNSTADSTYITGDAHIDGDLFTGSIYATGDSAIFSGYIRVDSVITLTQTYADYVFENDYKLENFFTDVFYAKKNKTLPKLISKNGNIGNRLEQTIETIERLYLQVYNNFKLIYILIFGLIVWNIIITFKLKNRIR